MPEAALPAYEAALLSVCPTVGFFRDEDEGPWRLEGGASRSAKARANSSDALALAAALTGVEVALRPRRDTRPKAGWRATSNHSPSN